MNTTIIKNHNDRVKPEDTVFFLGDFCFKNSSGGKKGEGTTNTAEDYLKQLNGRFVFIKGNHDNNNSLHTCIDAVNITLGGHEMYLVHRPEDFHEGYKINLVGHVHNAWKIKQVGKSTLINVGTDVWNFHPITINEILKYYHTWKSGVIK